MKALLVHSGACKNELEECRRWLEAEGCEVAVFDLNESSRLTRGKALTDLIAECDVVVFLVDDKLPLEEVQLGVLAANAKGSEIVSVQLGAKISTDVFEKYGSASVPFKQNLIVGAVCRHQPSWTDDDGNPREDQDLEHHKCKKQNPSKSNAAA